MSLDQKEAPNIELHGCTNRAYKHQDSSSSLSSGSNIINNDSPKIARPRKQPNKGACDLVPSIETASRKPSLVTVSIDSSATTGEVADLKQKSKVKNVLDVTDVTDSTGQQSGQSSLNGRVVTNEERGDAEGAGVGGEVEGRVGSAACNNLNLDEEKGLPSSDNKTINKDVKLTRHSGMVYGVTETPPPHMCFLFALQQVLLSISSTISIPLIVSREICSGHLDLVTSEIMATFLFMCGICTLLQVTFGVRLPIIQGGCHKFIPAVVALMSIEHWKCPPTELVVPSANFTETQLEKNITLFDETEVWQSRLREIQGGIILASLIQIVIGATGLIGFLMQFIGPLTIVPCITLVGLSLTGVALRFCEKHWGIAALTVFLVFVFSLYLAEAKPPFPVINKQRGCHKINYPIFKLLPVILAVAITWSLCAILTETDAFSKEGKERFARTDVKLSVIEKAEWFFFPYPGQWGIPTVSAAGVVAMLSATIASIIESVGDYYACARISSVPPPPAHALNRGIFMEGFGSLLSGVVGSGGATTSYSQNVGAIGFTRVASRTVFQVAGAIFIVSGIIGKVGAVLTTIPDPVLGGVVVVSFGMVTAVGLSSMQFVDLTSSRNLTIIGSSLLLGLMIPDYLKSNPNSIDTGNVEFNQVLGVLLSTPMFVGGLLGFVLDNTVPGTADERGVIKWRQQATPTGTMPTTTNDSENNDNTADTDSEMKVTSTSLYDIPFFMPILRRYACFRYVPCLPTFQVRPRVPDCCRRIKTRKRQIGAISKE